MILKIVIVLLILTALFVYLIVRASGRGVDEEMQKRLDDEQARIVAEMSERAGKD